ncbi:DedA family protein [Clostridium sp. AM34-11AC]|uniref:DedA family protein n=1 Tax=Clostridium sp. AM34-11AC TaxID=2305242 RepID=UPI000E4275E0|nr:DedA family protein [Clostridium sp. AM34-11AC]RGE08060.1 DedA family protein [Clostridium sp. AM34-11AC]
MRELVLELMGEYGNLAVFLLILVENLFPPIPSEVILTFGGVMTVCTDMTPVGVILFSTAGSLAGAVILYSVGRFLPDEVFRKLLCGQIGHLLHFHLEDVDLAKGWFRERGRSAVFLCRLIPIVRSLISIPAGIARMPFVPFLVFTAAGSLLWNTVLVYAGRIAGDSWEKVSAAFGVYSDLFLMIAGISITFAVLFRGCGERRKL